MPEPASSPLPNRRTQAERRAESERGLLGAAAALVAEEGVAAATLGRVGARAGYSRGLATQKFGSKQGLIEALIAHLHAELETSLSAARPDVLSGRDAVLAFVDLFLREFSDSTETRAYFMLLAGAVADASPLRAAFAASHERVRAILEGLVRRGQADGSIKRDMTAHQAATLVGTLLLGLAVQALVEAEAPPPGLADATRTLIAAGLAPV